MPGLIAKLDHCVIHVSDWAVSNPFYRDVLGGELIDRGHGAWAYRFGTEQLNVHAPGAIGDPVARIPVAPGNSDLCFEWDGPIEDAIEHLKRYQLEIEIGPAEPADNWRVARPSQGLVASRRLSHRYPTDESWVP